MIDGTVGLEDMMPWGQHEGIQIEDLIEDKPDYIRWLCEDSSIEFDEETLELIAKRGIA